MINNCYLKTGHRTGLFYVMILGLHIKMLVQIPVLLIYNKLNNIKV